MFLYHSQQSILQGRIELAGSEAADEGSGVWRDDDDAADLNHEDGSHSRQLRLMQV